MIFNLSTRSKHTTFSTNHLTDIDRLNTKT